MAGFAQGQVPPPAERGNRGDPLYDELLTITSAPVTAARHHWLRFSLCLVCGKPAAGQPARLVILLNLRHPQPPSAQIWSSAWLVHADHGLPDDFVLHRWAHARTCMGCPAETDPHITDHGPAPDAGPGRTHP
jgi:hypothetical protein